MIKKFVEENIVRDVKSFEHESELYTRYLGFCKFHNFEALTKIALGNQLKN